MALSNVTWSNLGKAMAVISLIANSLALAAGQQYKDWLIGIAVGFNSASIYILHNETLPPTITVKPTQQSTLQ